MVRSAKVLERMVNLNTFDEIAQDFREVVLNLEVFNNKPNVNFNN